MQSVCLLRRTLITTVQLSTGLLLGLSFLGAFGMWMALASCAIVAIAFGWQAPYNWSWKAFFRGRDFTRKVSFEATRSPIQERRERITTEVIATNIGTAIPSYER